MKRTAIFFIALLFSFSCSREETPVRTETTAGSTARNDETPQQGGTVYRRLEADISTLNPVHFTSAYDRLVANYFFTPMIQLDADLRPIPGLAEKWEISKDGKEYTFHLFEKATFSDGTPVKASDVLFTIRKILDPESESPQLGGAFEMIDVPRMRALDEHTIVIPFKEARASQMISFNDVLVLPEHVYSKGDFNHDFVSAKAVGSGPYTFVSREIGREVRGVRRKDYWGKMPYIDHVVFKVVNDGNTAWNAIKLKELDESYISSDTWVNEGRRPDLQKYIDFRRFYYLQYNYIAWNTRDPLLKDKRIRKALAKCVDLESIIKNLFHGTARAMSGPFTPDEWAYNPQVPVIQYDPATAQRELGALGWLDTDGDGLLDKGKKPLTFDMLTVSGNQASAPFVQLFQSELKRIGVQLNPVALDGATFIQRIISGNYQSAYLSWDLDPDPDPYNIFHSSQIPPKGQNFVFYSDPDSDRLMEQARYELDFDKRKELYHQLHARLAEEQPYTWTLQVSVKWAINKRLRNVKESRGKGLFGWYPGELDWWIPRELQGTPPAAAGASKAAK